MANEDHLKLIKSGTKAWNAWRYQDRRSNPDLTWVDLSVPDLRGANLSRANLYRADLSAAILAGANLRGADLSCARLNKADLERADLKDANLKTADLSKASLHRTDLTGADLSGAYLNRANLERANLSNSILKRTDLSSVDLSRADLTGADLRDAVIGWTTFGDNDLSNVKNLVTVRHVGPSTLGLATLLKSHGKIPDAFLRGAGIPEDFIRSLPSMLNRLESYSCFVSYSHDDEEFVRSLHSRMCRANLRVWYAPVDLKGGTKLHEEIFRAIQAHDKLLLVLSQNSMKSEWVMTEIRRARKIEREENRRKLFPIRLVDFDTIQTWQCFDSESKKDLAIEVREYYIPDFSNWKNQDSFEEEFGKLLRALKTLSISFSGKRD
jgi:uncharacterized protein YjbI with pentapeptide repeats